MDTGAKKSEVRLRLMNRLHDPSQLRATLTGLLVLLGYGAIYLPFSGDIEDTSRRLAAEQKRLELGRDVEKLRTQYRAFKHRIPEKVDANEWVQYVLAGIRHYPIKLVNLDSETPRAAGPYKVVVLRIELEGAFKDLNTFLRWLETNERLFRVDVVKLEPQRKSDTTLVMQLTVLGMTG